MNTYTRRQWMGMTAAAGFGLAAPRRQPNIIFIMADDHAAHAISCYGSTINNTPNIDRIAKAGVRLTNCSCTNSICTPSRASIQTGQYSHKNGVYTLADRLDPAKNTVAKELQRGGYQTAIIGKWHLVTNPGGFDFWKILPGQGAYQDPVFIEMGEKKQYQGYCTDLIADFSLEWLKNRDRRKPFFLMCHHKAPHRNWQPARKYQRLFENRTIPEPPNLFDHYEGHVKGLASTKNKVGEDTLEYDVKRPFPKDLRGDALRKWAYQYFIKDYLRWVQSVDDNVGRILGFVESEGLSSNTIVIYTSDQGFFLGDHGWFDKQLSYEEALRMPFLLQYPGAIRAGSVNLDIVLNIDFAALFLDFAGLKIPAEMQGRSFRANMEGRTPAGWRKSMYYRYWMHNTRDHYVPGHYGIRTTKWKLTYYYGKSLGHGTPPDTEPEWELFDIENDPHEMRNLYKESRYAAVLKQLKAELEKDQKKVGDQPVR